MKILAFSDYRIQSFGILKKAVKDYDPDVILYAGDDLERFMNYQDTVFVKTNSHFIPMNYPEFTPKFAEDKGLLDNSSFAKLQRISLFRDNINMQDIGKPFYYVNGNDEFIICYMGNYYIRVFDFRGYAITESNKAKKINIINGIYTSFGKKSNSENDHFGIYVQLNPSFGPFTIKHKKETIRIYGVECLYGLESQTKDVPDQYADIYLSHLPPIGTLDLSTRFGVKHIGSKRLKSTVQKYKPKLVICGHSHLWGGFSKKIGNTTVVNVSSHDHMGAESNFALINTENWDVEIKKYSEKKIKAVRGLRGVRRQIKDIAYYIGFDVKLRDVMKNIFLYNSKLTFSNFLSALEILQSYGINTEKVKERTKSLKWKKPRILKRITINPLNHAFVDVETGLAGANPGVLWLIGIWHKGDLKQFLIPEERKEFYTYLREKQITSLASWTQYDSKIIRQMLNRTGLNIKYIDACQRTANCVIWHTYKLHELYGDLFPEKSNKIDLIPGFMAGIYADHLIIPRKNCPYCPSKNKIIKKVMERNRLDLVQMVDICTFLWEWDNERKKIDKSKGLTEAQINKAVNNYRKAMSGRVNNLDQAVENYRRSLPRKTV